jgi:hypothetical protein
MYISEKAFLNSPLHKEKSGGMFVHRLSEGEGSHSDIGRCHYPFLVLGSAHR